MALTHDSFLRSPRLMALLMVSSSLLSIALLFCAYVWVQNLEVLVYNEYVHDEDVSSQGLVIELDLVYDD